MNTRADLPEDDVAQAAEYALRLLPPGERRAFEARLAREPALRALVAEWDEGLVPLADALPGVAPPPGLYPRLAARLFGAAAAPAPAGRPGWLRFGIGVTALVGLLAMAVLLRTPPDTGPAFRAEVASADASLVVRAAFRPETGILALERTAGASRPGRALELWVISDSLDGPASLGVLGPAPQLVVTVPEPLRAAVRGGVLALSDEPPGGSPTGAPTGAVVAIGPVTPVAGSRPEG